MSARTAARLAVPKLLQSGEPDVAGNGGAAAEVITRRLTVPAGKQIMGVGIKMAVNVAGSGTGTAYISESIKSLTVKAPGYGRPLIAAVTGKAIILIAFMQLMKYAAARHGPKVAQDAVIAAAATDYVFFANIYCPFPANVRDVDVTLDLNTLVTTGLTVSSVTTKSVVMKALFSDEIITDVDCFSLAGGYETITQLDDSAVMAFALAALNTDLGTLVSKLSLGEKLFSTQKIYELENEANAGLVGQNTAFGTPTINVYQPGIIAPWHASQRLFMVHHDGEVPGMFSLRGTSGAYAYAYRRKLSSE